ncbi:MAG: ParB/RepB/Spo0J family partition protein [Nitrospirota bacterium]|nr:ParB/RepB/Spo0J family partition protein [Nitrospirota bacterium]
MAKISLGRGIDSLYGSNQEDSSTGLPLSIPMSAINANPFQPRKNFDRESLGELASSLHRHGLLHPIIVVKNGLDGYTIVSGERRYRAAESLGWKEIPVIIKEFTDQELLEIALVENIKRSDLNPIEVAEGMKRLSEEFHWTQEHLSDYLGFKRSSVANYLRILDLNPEVRDSVKEGKLSFGHAKVLSSLKSAEEQIHWKNESVTKDLSVRALEQRIARKTKTPLEHDRSTTKWVDENRDVLRHALSCKANIHKLKKGWKVELTFNKMDDLERMITKLAEKFDEKQTEGF